MFTREQYMNSTDRESAHRKYYAQFITAEIQNLVKLTFTLNALKSAYKDDGNFNNIPLNAWDNLAACIKFKIKYASLSDKVCILKEAAKKLCE